MSISTTPIIEPSEKENMALDCGICLTNEKEIVVCWNDHSICSDCYNHCMESANQTLKKCAFCRESMFQWRDPQQDPVIVSSAELVAAAQADIAAERQEISQVRIRSEAFHQAWRDGGMVVFLQHQPDQLHGAAEYFRDVLEELLDDMLPDFDHESPLGRGDLLDLGRFPTPDERRNAWRNYQRAFTSLGYLLFRMRCIPIRYHNNLPEELTTNYGYATRDPSTGERGFIQDRNLWTMDKNKPAVPILHRRNRMAQFGTKFSLFRGNIRFERAGVCVSSREHQRQHPHSEWEYAPDPDSGYSPIPVSHEDYELLRQVEFLEDQLYFSPNWKRRDTYYEYVGEFGPWFKVDGKRYRLPVAKKRCDNEPFMHGKCRWCHAAGHRCNIVNGRPASCPCDIEKDYYRKKRIDFPSFYLS